MPIPETLLAGLLMRAADAALKNRRGILTRVHYWRLSRRIRVRVAMASIVAIHKDRKYLLVRNRHRAHAFGPFGGVLKYFPAAEPTLNRLHFENHVIEGHSDDMSRDIRGFIPGRSFPRFMSWYASGEHREFDCVVRELAEELSEGELEHCETPTLPTPLAFRKLHTGVDRPSRPPGVDYWQFRMFDCFELNTDDAATRDFRDRLFEIAEQCSDLLVVEPGDILRRRRGDRIIASHAAYLLSAEPLTDNDPSLPER